MPFHVQRSRKGWSKMCRRAIFNSSLWPSDLCWKGGKPKRMCVFNKRMKEQFVRIHFCAKCWWYDQCVGHLWSNKYFVETFADWRFIEQWNQIILMPYVFSHIFIQFNFTFDIGQMQLNLQSVDAFNRLQTLCQTKNKCCLCCFPFYRVAKMKCDMMLYVPTTKSIWNWFIFLFLVVRLF